MAFTYEVIGGDDGRFNTPLYLIKLLRKAIEKTLPASCSTLIWTRLLTNQTRHFLDRVVGFSPPPRQGLSAGRVAQSGIPVKLVVEREREVKAFQPEEFTGN